MSSSQKPNKLASHEFYRAAQFLWPHRKYVAVSMICALLAGAIMTSGIPAMVPILNVLTKENETVQSWVAKMVADREPDVPFYLRYMQQIADLMPTDKVKTVTVIFLAIAALAMVGNVVRFFYEYSSDKAVIGAVNDIRHRLYDHVLHLPLEFFGLQGTSDVTSRIVNDCQILLEGLNICLGQSALEVVRLTLALIAAMLIDWRLTMFIFLFMPLTAVVIRKFGKKMRRASRAALQNSSTMLGQIEGSLSGIRVVKAANAERFERRRYAGIMDGLRFQQTKMAFYDALSTPVLETLGMWGAGAVLIFATYLMFSNSVQHKLQLPWFFALMVALVTIGESIRKLSKLNSVLQRSRAAAARIFQTIDIPIERSRAVAMRRSFGGNNGHLTNLQPVEHEVRFEGISFSYPNTPAPAVSNVDLVVPRGKCVAVVGRNGSGKTTLMALLPRFYDPSAGRITIDGIDIRNVTLRSLRRQISVVTQESIIFPGTIAENIAYGLPLASREQIESAARRAFAHDFIMEKPLGYDAPLDGLGGQLSGGQRQRINIARAILRQTPILILDEATSQVDAESEHLIQQAIESLMHERTTFVIAHRFSTILDADWIVVMDRGQIIGQGQHDELLKTCPTYQQLYERQL
ncbi:MAG TPA: ABC transporter ATP-binding protein [Tepidisphaeraceae bacterium]|nr:ABC transporter ATP-binding protein [Tepidisphaeraceae bacterium]